MNVELWLCDECDGFRRKGEGGLALKILTPWGIGYKGPSCTEEEREKFHRDIEEFLNQKGYKFVWVPVL